MLETLKLTTVKHILGRILDNIMVVVLSHTQNEINFCEIVLVLSRKRLHFRKELLELKGK